MAVQGETKVVRAIVKALKYQIGGFWFKVHGGPFQRAGIPDLLGCVCGLYIAIEVKTRKGKTSGLQKSTMSLMRGNGALAFVSRSPEHAVKRVKKWLKKNGKNVKDPALQAAKKSGKVLIRPGRRSLVYGAGNWKDNYNSRGGRKAVPKVLH